MKVITDYQNTATLIIGCLSGPEEPSKEMILSVFRKHVFWPCIARQDISFLLAFCEKTGQYIAPYGILAKTLQDLLRGHKTTVSNAELMELHDLFLDDPKGQEIVHKLRPICSQHSVLL